MSPAADESFFPLADVELSRRLEQTEGKANSDFVETRERIFPESGAARLERAGAYAMFDGVSSPLTQTFCLGLFADPTGEDLDSIESFFATRGVAAQHEVSPMASPGTFQLLRDRGYEPFEFTNVLFRPIHKDIRLNGRRETQVTVRRALTTESEEWASAAAAGWGATAELADFLREIGRITVASRNATPFFGEIEGRPVATGTVCIHDGVALLAGASTLPESRKLGAQLALLETRLRFAAELGCDLAMMCAEPGSASQRNAERQGFRIAYTRMKWRPRVAGDSDVRL